MALANRSDEVTMQPLNSHKQPVKVSVRWAILPVVAAILSACGGGSAPESTTLNAAAATTTVALEVSAAELPIEAASDVAQPTFHLAPVLLAEPGDVDVLNSNASANQQPQVQSISAALDAVQTRGLTVQTIQDSQRMRALSAAGAEGMAKPLAASTAISTYTPAQIRAAYGLPALPVVSSASAIKTLTAAQAAQLGAGQTIYIVNAMHNPNVAAELSAFNQKFGLPSCAVKTVAVGTALPLAAAAVADGCTLNTVYSTPSGAISANAPAYNAGWATEIALDVQWAHATAPLARIVLIEAPDASSNSLLNAVKLANAMGPGVVSMSFGGAEGNWTASVDGTFAATGMSYLAATGDSGAAVSWPAVSPNVLAVGGTSLSYSGSGARAEVAWARTGGGVSAFTPTPAYQAVKIVPGAVALARRSVADVAFNADPSTGQFVAVMAPGASVVSWVSAGGTSLSTPQWAGLVAIANGLRAQTGKAKLGLTQSALYGQIGAVPGSYAAAFADITKGSHGSCASCTARAGYDQLTGLGTPNVSALLTALSGASTTTAAPVAAPKLQAPVITTTPLTGLAGKPLSGSFSVADPAGYAMSVSITGVPAGMKLSLSGTTVTISWASPATGKYTLNVTAQSSAGLASQATLPVTINAK